MFWTTLHLQENIYILTTLMLSGGSDKFAIFKNASPGI